MSQVAYRVDLVRPGEQVRNTSDSGCKLSRNEPPLNTTSGPHALQQSIPLFDHLVGGGEQRRRHIDAERLGSLDVDYQLVFGRRLRWQIGRLLASKDAIHVFGRAAVLVDIIRTIRCQAAVGDVKAGIVHRGQLVPGCQRDDQSAMSKNRRTRVTIRPPFPERAKAVTLRSISVASRTLIGVNSTPSDGAAVWIEPN
jgi:hypothetical protein